MEKIQTILSICYHVDAIKSCMDTLLHHPLDIFVVENYSEYTDNTIKPYILNLLKEKKIKGYFLFDRNITHNATKKVLIDNHINILETEYILVTNGNLSCKENYWLNNQIKILKEDQKVFTCAVPISLNNIPKNCDQENFQLPITAKLKNYNVGFTGKHMLLFRSKEFNNMLKNIFPNKPYIDASFHHYAMRINKKWAVLLEPEFYRHTWDLFKKENDPYLERKRKHFTMFWKHNEYCSYTKYTIDNEKRIEVEDKRGFILE